ncbi:hypothetical protein N866_16830 [Actinotalea ferrariae CF5-4]|uniref:Beta-xylosidase C-terminal Concanavalin A-like domain-containing protein n=1 Tax=Actinotalea ferrariae CF5-4 TaxID=948458 RepID=A0A021VVA4_9CELL|nr:DUF1349 domain-containing protein [Actinotalea ferrariae]EYR63965.1 hypothetical protein N866_16830 [Actinotalea ferrariae CF5-4]
MRRHRSRWGAALVAAALALTTGLTATTAAAVEAAPPSATTTTATAAQALPTFGFTEVLTVPEEMLYNPTGEFIFPSVFHAGAHLENPLGEYYLYFGPHDAPGGISLMYADSLAGPWTEYTANPVIARQWDPHYSVSHVASADAIWNEAEGRLFVYFHGENSTTRYATSTDGVTFEYGGVAWTNASGGAGVTESSYARVFEHPNPSSGFGYAAFYMANYTDNARRIRLAESVDGRTWRVAPGVVVSPEEGDGGNVSAGNLWEWEGQRYVVYHTSSGQIRARTIDATLRQVGPSMLLHASSGIAPDVGRVASPEIVTDATGTYLFYEAGARLDARIALATLGGTGPEEPEPLFPVDPANPVFERCAVVGSDEFDGVGPDLDPTVWDRVVRAESARHVVGGGVLTIPTYAAGVAGSPLPQQELPAGPWQVTTQVTIDVGARFQQAGLLLYASDTVYGKFGLGQATPGKRLEVVYQNGTTSRQDTEPPAVLEADTVWLRLTSDGASVQAGVSYDGATFADFGRPMSLTTTPFTHVGPYAFRGATAAPEIPATFDWFRWSPSPAEYEACLAAGEPAAEPDRPGRSEDAPGLDRVPGVVPAPGVPGGVTVVVPEHAAVVTRAPEAEDATGATG